MPPARQPLIRAICPTMLPTDPAAPETRTVCPGSGRPTSSRPKYAVSPLMPRAPRYVVADRESRMPRFDDVPDSKGSHHLTDLYRRHVAAARVHPRAHGRVDRQV